MKHYKNWGTVSGGAELYMMSYVERHRNELERERKANERRLPRANETNRRLIN